MSEARPAFEEEVFSHFPTQLMRRRYADRREMNKALRRLLLELERSGRNKVEGTSNIGGFHSDTKFLNLSDPAVVALRGLLTDAILAFLKPLLQSECARPPENLGLKLWGWGIVMRQGDANQQHMHPDAHISGVYYVHVPEQMKETRPGQPFGCISFVDPRPRANTMRLPNQISAHPFNPRAGDLLLFPAYYEHAVMPFRGAGERICIAFNARIAD